MNRLIAPLVAFSFMAAESQAASEIRVTPNGSQPSIKGAAQNFTGKVHVDGLFKGEPPARVGGGTVTFEPSARTAWHTHPLGQTLIVTQGRGWLQEWGKEAEVLNQGDIAWIPPGVKHWHGASAQTAMTHIAVAEAVNGSPVEWLEKVTDDQYPQP